MKIICFSFISLFLFSNLYAKVYIKNEYIDSFILYKKFTKEPSYVNALNLAQYFYTNKDYKNAVFWAIEANNIEYLEKDAWLIFINSKIQQGQIKEAAKAKEEYEKILNGKY
ncbi:hypothetical protein CINS5915_04220 [Campylobacter insulaenigrae]|uniref:Transformation system, membrane protein CtsX n=1 Tax=Campylobacter insulaenigrae TaxID=260714 RepID=A0ABY3G491_9BACT|nr:hypothetical protein [Campylobacter insulaenigrae]MCR6575569.1 hypothetical protein [Campylobacter insulaenigrae]MCR6584364.1 hypothetical protein [Campylobacter insulaenigrae]MCR6587948.1 hypothetical protein [Campylobacter insulaenigrae]MCR6593957.1 hypothetical protein [Campylobacter insulaenigrae]TWO26106.1 hypothetical protein ZA01_04720 [Campylobacter insulaenigrae]